MLKLYKSKDLFIVDAGNGKNAKTNYESQHLEGAIFVDLNSQMAEIEDDVSIGGRHPLPKIENFIKTLSNIGISPKSHVIIYDDKNVPAFLCIMIMMIYFNPSNRAFRA